MNPDTPQFWTKLTPGSVITLKDEKSLLKNMSGVETMVKRIIILPECHGICKWLMLELEEAFNKATQWLMVKMVDDTISYALYHIPTQFERGNRNDLVLGSDEPGHWIFQEPEIEEDEEIIPPTEIFGADKEEPQEIILNDLVYTDVFEWEGVIYRKKAQGDFACGDFDGGEAVVEKPKPAGIDYHQLATLAEYIADGKTDKPEALVFEIGDADDDDGGLVTVMTGHSLNANDLDILAK